MTNIPLYAMGSKVLWRKAVRSRDDAEPRELGERDRKIISLLRRNPKMSYEELAEALGVSHATVAKDLQRLKDERHLTRKGNRRTGLWSVL